MQRILVEFPAPMSGSLHPITAVPVGLMILPVVTGTALQYTHIHIIKNKMNLVLIS